MRNILTHLYHEADLDIIWKTVEEDLNSEIERLKARDEFLTNREKCPPEPTGVLDSELI